MSTEPQRSDLLQHLVEEGKNASSNTRMSTRQIVDQMSEILLAGSETTSGTTACLFLELARNPHVKAKLLANLPVRKAGDPIIGNKEIRNDSQYRYLNACIKENLRLHPIASEMGRRTGNDFVNLMGHELPPHTVVSASYRNLHRNGQYWPQPLRFWPERWLEGEERGDAPEPEYVTLSNSPSNTLADVFQHRCLFPILSWETLLHWNQVSIAMLQLLFAG